MKENVSEEDSISIKFFERAILILGLNNCIVMI